MTDTTMSPAEEAAWIAARDALISSWTTAKADLETIKAREMELRKQVTDLLFPNPVKGTQRTPLNNGWAIKLVHKVNVKLGDKDKRDDKGDLIAVQDQVEAVMDAIEKTGNEGAFLVERLIKTQYDLSESEYKKLTDSGTHKAIKKLLDDIIITTDASPSLELEEPKVK